MNGILLIDKPRDWTSSDVVAKLRGVLHEKRIGHAGTLDPMATGLLVLFIGRATRACSFAEAEDKTYRAALRLGLTTDTQDITGRVLREQDASAVTEEVLRAALRRFEGEIEQIPPMYSAIKQNGRKLYEIARRGGE
ncbi:MAG: tRNA pseudouridine(55) synthase TruB, partial [Clostridia bacterium]